MPTLRLSEEEARRLLAVLDRVGWQASVSAGGVTPEDARTADSVAARLRRASTAAEMLARPPVRLRAGG